MNDARRWHIWCEGYRAQGNEAEANLMTSDGGPIEAGSFAEACKKFFSDREDSHLFDQSRLTFWGCRLFDNEEDARREYG